MLWALFLLLSETPVWERSNDDFSNFIRDFQRVVVTETEDIYILDSDEQRIYHLDPQGREKNVFSQKGEGPDEMQGSFFIQYNQSLHTLFCYSWAKPKLYAFALDGKPLARTVPSKHRPTVLTKNQMVYIDGPESKQKPDLGAVITLENYLTTQKQALLTNSASQHQDPARISNNQGSAATSFTWYATSLLSVSPDLRWLAMGSNTALNFELYDLNQQKVIGRVQSTKVKRPPLLDEEIADNKMTITLGTKVFRAKDFWHPESKPPVRQIFFDTNGRLWVALTPTWRAKHHEYWIFSRDGNLAGQIQLPASHTILHASASHLWLDRFDQEEDIHYLVKHRYQLTKP